MGQQTTQLQNSIRQGQAQCDTLRSDIAQLQQELDKLYQARQHIQVAISRHEESYARAQRAVNSHNFQNRALRSYAASMAEMLDGGSKRRASEGLLSTQNEVDARIRQVQNQISDAQSRLSRLQNNIQELNKSLAQARQEEARNGMA